MWMRRVLAAVAAALVAGLATGAVTAYAAPTTADLAIAASARSGKVGLAVDVPYVIRNNGPQTAVGFTVEITAPPGTRIISTGGGICQPATGATARCTFGQLASGARRQLALRLRIDSAPTGCGAMAVNYGDDPRPGNNATNVRVTVDGQPRSCSGSTSPTATPKPTKTKSSPTATPTEEITEAAPVETTADETFGAGASQDTVGGGTSLGSVLVIGGGVVLVSLGGVLLWWMLRKDPEDADDDHTGPIYS